MCDFSKVLRDTGVERFKDADKHDVHVLRGLLQDTTAAAHPFHIQEGIELTQDTVDDYGKASSMHHKAEVERCNNEIRGIIDEGIRFPVSSSR